MALEFLHRAAKVRFRPVPGTVALLPGAWNPPTNAHAAMARAARLWAEEVVFVIPRALPHKEFEGVSFADRAALIQKLAASEEDWSAGITTGGLYFEMAAEAREALGALPEIGLLCGRDAAERIAAWDYGTPRVFEEMIARHPLLVASRSGLWQAPEHGERVVHLEMDTHFDPVSSSEVRRRLREGGDWKRLVPEPIQDEVARLYRSRG